MTRALLWITLVLATLVVIGIVVQVYLIAAYFFGAGQDALDLHEDLGGIVHGVEVLTFLATIGAFWRRWWDVGIGFLLGWVAISFAALRGWEDFRPRGWDPGTVTTNVQVAASRGLLGMHLDRVVADERAERVDEVTSLAEEP